MPSAAEIEVSVVVVGYAPAALLARCLSALREQCRAAVGVEVVVVAHDSHQGSALTPLREAFPEVRWLAAPPEYNVARMRGLGVAQARGGRVALLEGDCIPAKDWLARLVGLQPVTAIGGAVEPGDFRRAVDWAAYFAEFARFMAPLPPAPAQLPGTNVVYRRSALPDPAQLEQDGFYETFVHAALRSAGGLATDSGLVVHHQRRWRFRTLVATRFHHGRAYAALRVRGRAPGARVGYLVLVLGLPVLWLGRVLREIVGRGRLGWRAIQALPSLIVLALSWSAGEFVGYAMGPGASLDHWR